MANGLPAGSVLVPEPPRLVEYLALRRDTGMREKTTAQASAQLRGSWAFCHIREVGGRPLAMGRVIGDGGWYFTIADVATLPDYRRHGLGERVLEWLVDRIRMRAPEGAYVTVISDPPAWRLYGGAGFTEVVAPHGVAMQMVLEPL